MVFSYIYNNSVLVFFGGENVNEYLFFVIDSNTKIITTLKKAQQKILDFGRMFSGFPSIPPLAFFLLPRHIIMPCSSVFWQTLKYIFDNFKQLLLSEGKQ